MEQNQPGIESQLVDLTDVPLTELRAVDGPALDESTADLLRHVDDRTDSFAGYSPHAID
ncbi:FxSxx-COOH cyclophane-containing RiPP peptide [Streptomyces sp. SID3343]|uniref:FxSxx-COOH cyclophane-containing RiPP peptide n=1 Tax=Streptomyces sp. SID3343 TaxID=2690260 RepID=UPI00136FA997|nr:FxSxx-COOH cyclophane-containing RiPP peptide [Streptomyces sp. SID3343]MYV98702.1 FXSXX-COOH protein [Streptomyces sp. SID3343]